MRFSIVIPSYNRSGFLREAIASVCNQSFRDFELIVVDDGSTDDTRELVSSCITHQVIPVRYIFQENQERGAARNRGIQEARGEYIILLDSDDLLLPNHLAVYAQAISAHPDTVFFSAHYRFLDHEKLRNSSMQALREDSYDYSLFLKGNPLACNICFKRNHPGLVLFREDRRFAGMEDWIFFMENLRNTYVRIIPVVTLYMREHDARSMNQNKTIISRRIASTEFLKETLNLSDPEKNTLEIYSAYFCAIHSFLDNDPVQTKFYIRKARQFPGLGMKLFILQIKVWLGKKNSDVLIRLFK